jgi:hypothetical protein
MNRALGRVRYMRVAKHNGLIGTFTDAERKRSSNLRPKFQRNTSRGSPFSRLPPASDRASVSRPGIHILNERPSQLGVDLSAVPGHVGADSKRDH